eukprot:m.14952 g.14952  ORF g.14952 m.14952 type:complete len:577 (-) comp4847_c0_seq1:70-1800(-)
MPKGAHGALTWSDALADGSDVLKHVNAHRKRLSKLVRNEPVPPDLRHRLWLSHLLPAVPPPLAAEAAEARAAAYAAQTAQLPPDPAGPADVASALVDATARFACDPEFAAAVPPGELRVRVWRVLSAISLGHAASTGGDGAVYSPWHPGIVLGALRLPGAQEADAYAIGSALLQREGPRAAVGSGSAAREEGEALAPVVPASRLETWRMMHVMLRLCTKLLSGKKRGALRAEWADEGGGQGLFDASGLGGGYHPLGPLVTEWTWRLPLNTADWALDCFVIEGTKLFYRLALGCLRLCAKQRIHGGTSGPAKGGVLPDLARLDDSSAVIDSAYSFRFKQSGISRYHTRFSDESTRAMGRTGSVRGVAEREMVSPTAVLAGGKFVDPVGEGEGVAARLPAGALEAVWAAVPPRFRHREQSLLFTTARDGFRLAALYDACGQHSPLVLLVRTVAGETVGAYLSHPFSTPRSGYYGGGETFLLTLREGADTPVVFPWVGVAGPSSDRQSELFLFADAERLAVGGGGHAGGHALELDAELDFGITSASKTFGNPPLTTVDNAQRDVMFRVAAVEVWGFDSD